MISKCKICGKTYKVQVIFGDTNHDPNACQKCNNEATL